MGGGGSRGLYDGYPQPQHLTAGDRGEEERGRLMQMMQGPQGQLPHRDLEMRDRRPYEDERVGGQGGYGGRKRERKEGPRESDVDHDERGRGAVNMQDRERERERERERGRERGRERERGR